MTLATVGRVLALGALLTASTATLAVAQEPVVEVGASMMNVTVGLGDNNTTLIGIPTGGFGLLSPAVYASLFVGPYVSVEPQVGLIVVHDSGSTEHIANISAQFNYFLRGTREGSPYVFGAAGILDGSGSNTNPKTVGGGAGYRFTMGDRLTFRIDGRYMHFTEDGGNAVMFGLSLGGVFNR